MALETSPTPIEYRDLARAEEVFAEMAAIYERADDVHTHTRSLGQMCREVFVSMEERFQFAEAALSLEDTIRQVQDFCGDDAEVSRVLASIAGAGDSIEGETGFNAKTLLIKTWAMTNHPACFELKGNLIDNLRHNIQTGGGCLAGICGRLIQPYSAAIVLLLRDALVGPGVRDEAAREDGFGEEWDLLRAIEASKAEAAAASAEESELDRALRESAEMAAFEQAAYFPSGNGASPADGDDSSESDEDFEVAKSEIIGYCSARMTEQAIGLVELMYPQYADRLMTIIAGYIEAQCQAAFRY